MMTHRTRQTRLRESLKQERSFLNVPLKRFKKTVKANQYFVKNETTAVIYTAEVVADNGHEWSVHDAVEMLDSVRSRLVDVKRELKDRRFNEHLQAERFKRRLTHINLANLVTFPYWKTLRMSRILVDYLLRMSYRDTAIKLAEITDIKKFIDLEEFDEARNVISALKNKEVAPALAWCANNSELYMLESTLELDLRLQEFVELVRAENKLQALTYAQKYLAPWGTIYLKKVQRVLATLAFGSSTQCARYKVLFEAKQWDNLVDQFKQDFYKLHGMTYEPLLYIYLQAGLCALKTPFCYKDDCNKADPLSQECLRKIAEPLPIPMQFCKENPPAKLVCYITGEQMGPGNQPVMLPNGYIYSNKACNYMICQNNGKITCPRTGTVCRAEDVLHLKIRGRQ